MTNTLGLAWAAFALLSSATDGSSAGEGWDMTNTLGLAWAAFALLSSATDGSSAGEGEQYSCGGHYAASCFECGNNESFCHGDCKWNGVKCTAEVTEGTTYQAKANGPGCSEASITSSSECQTAATSLGFTGELHVGNWKHAPHGCHVGHPNDGWAHIYFNKNLNGKTGRSIYQSICLSGCFTGDLPEAQIHGDWFCLPSSKAVTCHLECHPGYVSTNGTVITCQHGEWFPTPTCVTAVAIITGGFHVENAVEVYGEEVHKKLDNLPDNRYSHSLKLINSVLLLCGGGSTTTSCLEFTSSQQWTPHSITTFPRFSHSSVSMLGQLHLLGGWDNRTTTEQLTPPTHNWSNGWDLLESTYHACAAKIEPELLMVTGGSYNLGSVVSYNVISGVATRLQDLITPRSGHGCVYVRESDTGFRGVIVAGGYDGRNFLRDSEIYDVKTGEWSTTGHLTNKRYGVRLVVLGEEILALGGLDGSSDLSTVDRFNLTTRKWTATEEMLEARVFHAVTGVPSSAVGINQK